jgi:hypothetical protein
MIIYKIEVGNTTIQFANRQLAEDYLIDNNVTATIDELVIEDVVPQIDYVDRYYKDIAFGKFLIDEFLKDNRLTTISFTPQESIGLLYKFQGVEALCRLGDIQSVHSLMLSITTDTVFTTERKAKYLQLLAEHILNVHEKVA